jgi:type IV pilus biogenesis protein CpaD/CtpE
MTRKNQYKATLLCAVTLFFAGCNKQDNSKPNYQAAINNYYKAHPLCVWQDTKKLPVQAATSDDAKTEGFDALTDAGLLTRTS